MTRVCVVRPYGSQIRDRVLDLLERAGFTAAEDDIIPKGTGDDQVVETLRRQRPAALLIPFHAHRSARGELVNGVDLIERLFDAAPELLGTPIIMPASVPALPAVHLRLSSAAPRPLPERIRESILVVDETHLDDPGLASEIRAHVRRSLAKLQR